MPAPSRPDGTAMRLIDQQLIRTIPLAERSA